MILVDELRIWPHARAPFLRGSCHLTVCDEKEGLETLHRFAQNLGLRRAWFQDHPLAPHYDLTPEKRARALAAGAVFVSALHQARARRAGRAGHTALARKTKP